MGLILFYIFLSDLLTVLTKPQLYKFANDNSFPEEVNNTDELLEILKEESESALKCFKENNMIVNPDKFLTIVLQKGNWNKSTNNTLKMENITTNSPQLVELLRVTIDNELNFGKHISKLCKKTSL